MSDTVSKEAAYWAAVEGNHWVQRDDLEGGGIEYEIYNRHGLICTVKEPELDSDGEGGTTGGGSWNPKDVASKIATLLDSIVPT